jgi:tetratricopeptide (TPR) repeat protein
LASSLAAAGDRKKAEEVYRQAIAADPTYAAPHYNLALLLRRLGRLAEADEEFWLAVDLGIADPELTVVRAALDYREKGELARAEALFRGGLARFPRSVPLLVNAGVFFGELGKLQEAKALLLRAVELDPQNGKARRNLAVALAQLGDHQGAIAQLEKVLQLDPRDEQARQELARLRALGIQ